MVDQHEAARAGPVAQEVARARDHVGGAVRLAQARARHDTDLVGETVPERAQRERLVVAEPREEGAKVLDAHEPLAERPPLGHRAAAAVDVEAPVRGAVDLFRQHAALLSQARDLQPGRRPF